MRRVRHCHKVCSLFGTVSALQLVSEVGLSALQCQ